MKDTFQTTHIKPGIIRIFVSMIIFIILVLGGLYIWGKSLDFENRYAPVVYDQTGKILSASVSTDQQWRIRCEGEMPNKLKIAIRLFEDEYFYQHIGINPIALYKALYTNWEAGKVKRGGSTITMQLARIYYKNQKRSYNQKIKEIFLALAIEIYYTKDEILKMYGQFAPFGGNIVGYCAAAHKYYGKPSNLLSWSEAVTLAVLPNAPSDVFPGKGQAKLQKKRNYLLHKLLQKKIIDSLTFRLSLREDIPSQSNFFKNLTPHLLTNFKTDPKLNTITNNGNYHTTIDYKLQSATINVVNTYHKQYVANGIDNMAVLILRNDGSIASYVSNTTCKTKDCGHDVDIIHSFRSPGSIIKPFLYGLALDEGIISTKSLLLDIPSFYNGFSPKNFDKKFRGIVPADQALTMSLNVPAVNLLAKYGLDAFLDDLQLLGFDNTSKTADHYGLSLILGGNEVSMMEVGRAYMNLVRTARADKPINPTIMRSQETKYKHSSFPISQGASWLVLEMMTGVNRPHSQDGWQYFSHKKKISWKTGTSYGFRDAWSVGVTKDYTVVVWVGNADGEGKNGLTGVKKAAPILFSTFELLPQSEDIYPRYNQLKYQSLCKQSGYIATSSCLESVQVQIPINSHHLPLCKYHKIYTVDSTKTYRINNSCSEMKNTIQQAYFVLNPIVNSYYSKYSTADYNPPPLSPSCIESDNKLGIIYPLNNANILIPIDVNGKQEELICMATNTEEENKLFWFLDDQYIKETEGIHKIKIQTNIGSHRVTILSASGQRRTHQFVVIE